MPFNQPIPRPLTAGAIQMYAPAASGVYGITNASEWIYVGETDSIQDSLLNHLHEPDTAAMRRLPTGFVFEICDRTQRPARQGRLVGEYGPTCNRDTQVFADR
jgi:hypothetical protein